MSSSKATNEEIRALYLAGRTRNQISEITNTGHNRVQKIIKSASTTDRLIHNKTKLARLTRFRQVNKSRHIPIPFQKRASIEASILARRGNRISSERRQFIQGLIEDISP